LFLDQPGTGEALRLRDIKANPKSEQPVSAALDHLETFREIDTDRVGVVGVSLGGYYAPRAAAFEKRLVACVAWGAIWNYAELCRQRVAAGNPNIYTDWLDQFLYVFGGKHVEEALNITDQMNVSHFIGDFDLSFPGRARRP
jgi:dienelactone hydrolase